MKENNFSLKKSFMDFEFELKILSYLYDPNFQSYENLNLKAMNEFISTN